VCLGSEQAQYFYVGSNESIFVLGEMFPKSISIFIFTHVVFSSSLCSIMPS
jgi:hypothetical protein